MEYEFLWALEREAGRTRGLVCIEDAVPKHLEKREREAILLSVSLSVSKTSLRGRYSL